MRTKDDSAPATKGDVKLILTHLSYTEKRLTSVEKHVGEIQSDMNGMKNDMNGMKEELKRYMDVKLELLYHDFVGATKDDVQSVRDRVHDHEFRIQVLESKC